MYFGRTETADGFRERFPDRVREVPERVARVAVTRCGRIVALEEFDQAAEI